MIKQEASIESKPPETLALARHWVINRRLGLLAARSVKQFRMKGKQILL